MVVNTTNQGSYNLELMYHNVFVIVTNVRLVIYLYMCCKEEVECVVQVMSRYGDLLCV